MLSVYLSAKTGPYYNLWLQYQYVLYLESYEERERKAEKRLGNKGYMKSLKWNEWRER